MFKRLLTILMLLLLCASASRAQLGTQVMPLFQSIELNLDPNKPDYSGVVRMELSVTAATDTFSFHSRQLVIESLDLQTGKGKVDLRFERDKDDTTIVRIKTSKVLQPGIFRLRISFHNNYNTKAAALYKVTTEGNSYLFTQFEADEAREAFPCFDEPLFKFPYQMTVVVPKELLVVSNTPIQREATKGESKTVVFERTEPLPSYLLAVAVGPFDTLPITGMSVPGRVVAVKGQAWRAAETAAMTAKILPAMEKYFGRPYPYAKLDLIAAPEFLYGAMENAGAIVFREGALLLDSGKTTIDGRRRSATTISHELAHMWFGDLVTMAWWNDLWLNESFASWMGDKIADQEFPELNNSASRVRSANGAMTADSRPSIGPIRRENMTPSNLWQNANALVYNKGQAVLEMFETWLTPDTFRLGIVEYLKRHEWKNATADDLWAALSSVSSPEIVHAISSFVEQPGMPLVTVDSVSSSGIWLRQERYKILSAVKTDSSETAANQHWGIPLTLAVVKGGEKQIIKTLMTSEQQFVPVDQADQITWLFPNDNLNGYYRWNLPSHLFDSLVNRSLERLSVPERVGVLQNVTGLLRAGEVQARSYLKIVRSSLADPDPQVVTAGLDALSFVQSSLVEPGDEAAFAKYARPLLQPAIDRFGILAKPNEPTAAASLRLRMLGWLVEDFSDSAACKLVDSIVAVSETGGSVDQQLLNASFPLSMIRADKKRFEECRSRFENSKTPQERGLYLSGLGRPKDQAIIKEALAYSLSGNMRPQEVTTIARTVNIASRSYQPMVFDWILQNFDTLSTRLAKPRWPGLIGYVPDCDEQALKRAREFFLKPSRHVDGMEAELIEEEDAIRQCLALRARFGDQIRDEWKTVH